MTNQTETLTNTNVESADQTKNTATPNSTTTDTTTPTKTTPTKATAPENAIKDIFVDIDPKKFRKTPCEEVRLEINKSFLTADDLVINYYNDLCDRGRLGQRLAELIAMDAYGEIKNMKETSSLKDAEKIDLICSTMITLSDIVARGQTVNQKNTSVQSMVVQKITELTNVVNNQQSLLLAVRVALKKSGQLTDEQIEFLIAKLQSK